jgi:hypothetical protein
MFIIFRAWKFLKIMFVDATVMFLLLYVVGHLARLILWR